MICSPVLAASLRPPAIPLVTHSPYFSIWQMSDRLTDEWPKHWTGVPHALCGMIRIDGKTYRFLGPNSAGLGLPALEQTDLQVTPTRTIATFTAAGVELQLTFCSPLLPHDLNMFARPVTYISFEVRSTDGAPHTTQIYLDACAEIAVHTPDQEITVPNEALGYATVSIGSAAQKVLGRAGDSVRIDWGYLYLATSSKGQHSIGAAKTLRQEFAEAGKFPGGFGWMDDPRPVREDWWVLAVHFDFAQVKTEPKSGYAMIAYDEIETVEYLRQRLRPYWKLRHTDALEMLGQASKDYVQVFEACRQFDEQLMSDLTKAGGEKYAALCALAYRQAIAGHGLAASTDGRPFMFSKENSSNGCIGTVDVIYPTAPLFLLLSPELMEANLAPVMEYAASARWKFDFAPHDLGTYPLANGQVYGGGEKTEENQMPVEESANMLILVAALEKATGKPSQLATKHRALLKRWADYLLAKGLDPENQLCTDDFTGHLAHNVNLSAKAIIGIAAYGRISGDETYIEQAKAMAGRWIEMADDGDHTKLAFDKPGTWSQKYNLVWDKVLGLNLFPLKLLQREVDYYKSKSNKYGPPLDNRASFAKLDWTAWSACLSDDPADFAALIDPLYDFAHETPDRVPLTDWYFTDTGRHQHFRARPVVGGLFMKMLCDEEMWKKWARRTTDH